MIDLGYLAAPKRRQGFTDGNIIEAILAAKAGKEVLFIAESAEDLPDERIKDFLGLVDLPVTIRHRPLIIYIGEGKIIGRVYQDGQGIRGMSPDHVVYEESADE